MSFVFTRTSMLGVALIGGLFSMSHCAWAQQNVADILDSSETNPPTTRSIGQTNHGMADRLARALEIHNNPDKRDSYPGARDTGTKQAADFPVATRLAARLQEHELASAVELSRADSRSRRADAPAENQHPRADEIAQRLADYYASSSPAAH